MINSRFHGLNVGIGSERMRDINVQFIPRVGVYVIRIEIREVFGAVIGSAGNFYFCTRNSIKNVSRLSESVAVADFSPVSKLSTENVNRSQLVTDAHLMFRDDRGTVFEAGVFANQNPRLSRHVEEIEVALSGENKGI